MRVVALPVASTCGLVHPGDSYFSCGPAGRSLFSLGCSFPDYRAGVPVSGIGALAGADYVGYGAGFGNTFGILTFAMAITAAVIAFNANRRSARMQQGVTDEVLEEQARQQSPYDFLD